MWSRPITLLAAGLAVLGAAGCGTTSGPAAARPAMATTAVTAAAAMAPLPTCGALPRTDGPSRRVIGVSATGPAQAASGSTVAVQVHVRSLDGRPHTLHSGWIPLLVLQHGHVVGEYEGAIAAYGIEARISRTRGATLDASVLLSGCPLQPVDIAAPDLTRKALPPGTYQLVAAVSDVSARPFGQLATAPITIRVTAPALTLPTCGDVPVSTGPSRGRIGAVLQAPSTAKPGSTVRVQVLLHSERGKAEHLESGLPIEVLVIRDGSVVGRTDGPIAGVGLDLTVPASGTVPLIDARHHYPAYYGDVTLSGCPQGVEQSSPTARRPLPPGTYQVVADFEDDSVTGKDGVLLSDPATIRVG